MMAAIGNVTRDKPLLHIAADQLGWLDGVSRAERGACTAHRSTYTDAEPSASTWDQQSTMEERGVRGCDFLTGPGTKYFTLVNPDKGNCANDDTCNNDLANRFDLKLREQIELSAISLMNSVKAVDDAYGITEALRNGTTPTVPDSVSAIHYSTHTKFSETVADIEWYSLRDGCQFMMHWDGHCKSVCWQYAALYAGFMVATDDMCVPPWDIATGKYLYHGQSLDNIVHMICKTSPKDAAAWYSTLWNAMMRTVWIQYLEKTGAEIARVTPQASNSDILKQFQSKGMAIHAIETRTISAGVEGSIAVLSASRGLARDEVCNCAIHDAAVGHVMAFDMSKDQQGIMHLDPTNSLALDQGDKEAAEVESRRQVFRQTLCVVAQTVALNPLAAEVCTIYMFSAPLYTRFLERYLDRTLATRAKSSAALCRLIEHIRERRQHDVQQ